MKMRASVLIALALCILGGLISAIFTPAIASTLTVPAVTGKVQATATTRPQPAEPVQPTVPGVVAQPTMLGNGVTVLAQDTFQRSDQSFWGTSSDHRTWGGDANSNPIFMIRRSAGQIIGGKGAFQATLGVAVADSEVLISGMVSKFDKNGNSNLGVVLRWQDTNNWYKVLIDGAHLQLISDVHGEMNVLASQPFTATSGTSYSIRFRAQGSNLFAKAWPSSSAEPTNWTFMKIDTQLTTGMSGVRVKVVPGVVMSVTRFIETSVPNTV